MNKTLVKTTAIVVCFAFLLLAFPNVIQAKPRTSKFYNNFFRKPLAIFAEFFSFLPFYDIPVYEQPQQVPTKRTTRSNKLSKNLKITGDINRGRVAKED
jgi:hypothetical protein